MKLPFNLLQRQDARITFKKWRPWSKIKNSLNGGQGAVEEPRKSHDVNSTPLIKVEDEIPVRLEEHYTTDFFDKSHLNGQLEKAENEAKQMPRAGRLAERNDLDLSQELGGVAPDEKEFFFKIEKMVSSGEDYCTRFLQFSITQYSRLEKYDPNYEYEKFKRKIEAEFIKDLQSLQAKYEVFDEEHSKLSEQLSTMEAEEFDYSPPLEPAFYHKLENYLIIMGGICVPEIKLNFEAMNLFMGGNNLSLYFLVSFLSIIFGYSAHELGSSIERKDKQKISLWGGIPTALFGFVGYYRLQSGDGALFIIAVGIIAFTIGTYFAFKREKHLRYWSLKEATAQSLNDKETCKLQIDNLPMEKDNRLVEFRENDTQRIKNEINAHEELQQTVSAEMERFQKNMESIWFKACNAYRNGYRSQRRRNKREVHPSWKDNPPSLSELSEVL